jgi:hypothetical protein
VLVVGAAVVAVVVGAAVVAGGGVGRVVGAAVGGGVGRGAVVAGRVVGGTVVGATVVVVVVADGSGTSKGGGWRPYFSGSFTPSHTKTWSPLRTRVGKYSEMCIGRRTHPCDAG